MYFLRARIESSSAALAEARVPHFARENKELNLEIEKEDAVKGVIIVPCLNVPINWILWRCWSDKLLFEMRETEGGKTVVNVYATPNLLRMSLRRDERVVDLGVS